MAKSRLDSFGARSTLKAGGGSFDIFRLDRLGDLSKLPVTIRIMVENTLRNEDGRVVKREDVETMSRWNAASPAAREVAFLPSRVLLQDFTGVPAVCDLAAMRDAMQRLGGSPSRINPIIPADLVIDHSVQVDQFGTAGAMAHNAELEFQRNGERYSFLRWGQTSFRNFRVVPPDTGIVHQVNLEYLAQVVFSADEDGKKLAYPDSLVGTDSHTTMVNGLGVFGWGCGGIEAEAVMLGQPYYMLPPQVVGMKLTGQLRPGTTATDLVLTVTQILRKKGVVEKFVEFYGPGLSQLSLADRATIANMAPEYGATMGFFPVDEETLKYLRLTGRSDEQVALVEAYTKEQGIFRTDATAEAIYSDTVELDISTVEPSLAGPKRPQDRVPLTKMKPAFFDAMKSGYGKETGSLTSVAGQRSDSFPTDHVAVQGADASITHGAVVIAAITSCTNTSNPSVLMAAGLLAKKAVARGLGVKPWVKTSLAPGSKVVPEYLREAGLLSALEQLKFNVVGFGCTTCIGNSGPVPDNVADAIKAKDLVVAAVLSGNRNFEGRINPLTRANYLASPPLVVAYALAGTVDIDMDNEPLGTGTDGKPVYLKEIWPTPDELADVMKRCVKPEMFRSQYASVFDGDENWRSIRVPEGERYKWDAASSYIKAPSFFEEMTRELPPARDIEGARVLAYLGDSVTTDHISPAGNIAADSPAAKYLIENGVAKADFNSYGARRGNHEVMVRGTFANIRLKNLLVAGVEGGVTAHLPDGAQMSIYDAAMQYKFEGTPVIILGGKEYGSGSSRDWAAKGPLLLGVRAVIAESFERIHRSNLVGMGILPLLFTNSETAQSLGLTGKERYSIKGIAAGVRPGQKFTVEAKSDDGKTKQFEVLSRIDSEVDVDYFRHGGILPAVIRGMLAS